MTIKIGDKSLAVKTPADLDAALAHTGLSAAEILTQLRAGGYASHVARALHPFVEADGVSLAELGNMVGGDDVDAVRAKVIALYEPKAEKAA